MPTYCIPQVVGVPGRPATSLDWWTTPPVRPLENYPEDPNWLGCFSLGEGGGEATTYSQVQFRALSGIEGTDRYLYLSWTVLVQPNPPQPNFDGLNLLIGDGTNYIALKIRLATASQTISGDQATAYAIDSYDYTSTGGLVPHGLAVPWATDQGRAWIIHTSPISTIVPVPVIPWALQLRVPLGVDLAPAGSPAVSLPLDASFKLWYQLNVYVAGAGAIVPYPWPGTPYSTSELDFIPAGLSPADVGLPGQAGCAAAVSLPTQSLAAIGIEDVGTATARDKIQLDLTNTPPDYAQPQHQNRFYARPTGVAGLTTDQRDSLRARFRLANWGTQYSVPTPNSWKIIPGGDEVTYQAANAPFPEEFACIWPRPGMTPSGEAFTTDFIDGVNLYDSTGGTSGQNPHQCMLVEMWSSDPGVVFTKSSAFKNLRAINASVFREAAEVSVVGNPPIGPGPRDVWLYLETLGLPQLVEFVTPRPPEDLPTAMTEIGEDTNPLDHFPSYQVHAYYDTGDRMTYADGSSLRILRPQTSFGYLVSHKGELIGWDTRLYGAEKVRDNLYVVRVPNESAVRVTVAIQARESSADQPLPPDGVALTSCDGIAAWLDSFGIVGRLLARLVRLLCSAMGDLWWVGALAILALILVVLWLWLGA